MIVRVPLERVLFWLYVALLAWVPVPLGSNRVWAWSILELSAYALLAAWLVLRLMRRLRTPSAVARARPILWLLAAWLAYQGLYVVPMPLPWVAALSPEAARMHSLAGAMGAMPSTATLAVDRDAAVAALLKSLAYAAIFVLALALARRRERVATLANVLVYAAVAQSTYAVLAHLADLRVTYFGATIHHGASASGTYVNRNHLAGYLEMTLAIGIGLLIAGVSQRTYDSWKRFFADLFAWVLSPGMVMRLSLCVLVIALTTTHSRMGNTAFFSSVLIAGVVGIALSRRATRNTVILLASLILIDLAIVGSWFGVERLAQRIGDTTLTDVEQREEPAVYAMSMIRDYGVLGAGPGSFYTTFPRYRPPSLDAFFDYAHNDYAQFAAESGVLGLAILGAIVATSLAAAIRGQWLRRDPLMRGMSFACIMGVTSILIHSWVDFNLQIPANACYFMLLLALGWISLHLGREDRYHTAEERD